MNCLRWVAVIESLCDLKCLLNLFSKFVDELCELIDTMLLDFDDGERWMTFMQSDGWTEVVMKHGIWVKWIFQVEETVIWRNNDKDEIDWWAKC